MMEPWTTLNDVTGRSMHPTMGVISVMSTSVKVVVEINRNRVWKFFGYTSLCTKRTAALRKVRRAAG